MSLQGASSTVGLAVAAFAGIGSVFILLRSRQTPQLTKYLIPVCIPLLLFLLVMACFIGIARGQFSDWDAARLAVPVAASQGHQVYSTLTTGSVQTSMYPPGWILTYLPVSLGKTPTAVMLTGYVLAQIFTFLPIALMCMLLSKKRSHALVGIAVFVFFSARSVVLELACFLPHADAPALGFALASALFLYMAIKKPDRPGWLIAATLATCLSIGSKQTMLPIAPALLIWAGVASGRKLALRFLLALVATGTLCLALSVFLFPADGLLLNLVTIPSRHPWRGLFPYNLLAVTRELGSMCLVPVLVVAAGSAFAYASRAGDVTQKLWPLLGLSAVLLLPSSILGRVKVGGAESALAPTLYFLYASVCAMCLEFFAPYEKDSPDRRVLSACRYFAFTAIIAISSLWLLRTFQEVRYGFRSPSDNLSQQAYDFLVSHEEQAYFPAYPLAHLLAEGRLYHFSQAIADREHDASIPIDDAQREAHFPRNPALVCWSSRLFNTERLRVPGYFTGYHKRTPVPELPDFICFRKNTSDTATPTNGK